MIYKRSILKTIALTLCVPFLYGGLVYITTKLESMALSIGAISFLCVFIVDLAMFFSLKNVEKKAKHLHIEISKVRKIICEGWAGSISGISGSGGWLFLTEDAIEFYPISSFFSISFGAKNIAILIDDIAIVETKLNISTKNGQVFKFRVEKSQLWKQSIIKIL